MILMNESEPRLNSRAQRKCKTENKRQKLRKPLIDMIKKENRTMTNKNFF